MDVLKVHGKVSILADWDEVRVLPTADEMREAAIVAADYERRLIRLAFHWRWGTFAKCDACGCPAPGTSLYIAARCTKPECVGRFRPAGYTPPAFPYVRVRLFP